MFDLQADFPSTHSERYSDRLLANAEGRFDQQMIDGLIEDGAAKTATTRSNPSTSLDHAMQNLYVSGVCGTMSNNSNSLYIYIYMYLHPRPSCS